MRRTEKSLFFTVSLIVVCGFAILSLERYLCGERPRQVLSRTADDELVRAMATDDPTSPASRMVAGMHAQWIKVHWGENA